MSALGAAPGYTYPRLDYASAEFLDSTKPNLVISVPGQNNLDVIRADAGFAILVTQMEILLTNTGDVGTRNLFGVILDANSSFVASWASPKAPGAAEVSRHIWNTALSNSYVAANNGYSPFTSLIMPPGYKVQCIIIGAFAGDIVADFRATGLRIPTVGTEARQDAVIPTPRVA